jgi:hypothetical protein
MTLQKIPLPLVLLIFTVVCALPAAAAAVIPSAIAQEENASLGEDLAGGILSDVLDGGDAVGNENVQDATNTATINPNQEQDLDQTDFNVFGDETADLIQDQSQANVAVPIGIPVNVEEEEEIVVTPTTPPSLPDDGGLPPEFVAFCHGLDGRIACYDTLEDCEEVGELLGVQCEGVETVPQLPCDCEVIEIMGVPTAVCQCPD